MRATLHPGPTVAQSPDALRAAQEDGKFDVKPAARITATPP